MIIYRFNIILSSSKIYRGSSTFIVVLELGARQRISLSLRDTSATESGRFLTTTVIRALPFPFLVDVLPGAAPIAN